MLNLDASFVEENRESFDLNELLNKQVLLRGLVRGFVDAEDGEHAESIFFILNNHLYGASVDKSDGYRSYTRFFKIGLEKLKAYKKQLNQFEAVEVIIEHIPQPKTEHEPERPSTGLIFYCTHTGEELVRAGTDYYDSYYPNCVFSINLAELQKSIAENLADSIGKRVKNGKTAKNGKI